MHSEIDLNEEASEADLEKTVESGQVNDHETGHKIAFEATPGIGPEAQDGKTKDPESEPDDQLPRPPDGGFHAWLKVFGGFIVYINIWGFTISYGAFQTYYQHELLSSSSASAISWIGTVQAWLLIVVGVLSGPLFDLGYFRSMLYAGNFLIVLGIMMLSLATEYYQVFLAQGICMGLGAGLLYIPSLALVGIWFERRRALALGIVMSGTAVGNLVTLTSFPYSK
jgi:magnesium-transporting ATPase (P-type)